MNYYNEFDRRKAKELKRLVAEGAIPAGDVDDRPIQEVRPHEIARYTQHHFFAGIGGWSLALELAGWPTSRRVRTGSCPCGPFSNAGNMLAEDDPRHLWPIFCDHITFGEPTITFGEQVASKAGISWMSGVRSDLEGRGYEVGASDLPAASVGAPHVRQRLYWVANPTGRGREGFERCGCGHAPENRTPEALDPWHGSGHPFEHWQEFLAEPYAGRVVDGLSSGVDVRPRLHAYGDAIVPQLAAIFIRSAVEAIDPR